MTHEPHDARITVFKVHMSEFWSGDLGLTLVTLAVTVLVFVIIPLREAGIQGRVFFDLIVVALMVSAALVVNQTRASSVAVVIIVLATAVVLTVGRAHPTLFLRELGSALVTITLLLYVRIVLLVMFRGGPVTWSRIQGGVCGYLLLGMAWASAYQFVEQIHPGAFQFVSPPMDMDQLTAKLVYFSFATLTTVGSDIAPIHPFARSMSVMEAVVGQLYPAILIGAVVSMAMQVRPKS
jgi:Ion channel